MIHVIPPALSMLQLSNPDCEGSVEIPTSTRDMTYVLLIKLGQFLPYKLVLYG